MSDSIATQTQKALEFLQKLYFEISYLIKEVEGFLGQDEEVFLIGRPSGYSVTTKYSTGLDRVNVAQWIPKAFTVFWVAEKDTKSSKGTTVTRFSSGLRLLLAHIDLDPRDHEEPRLLAGVIHTIKNKKTSSTKKFEQLMWEFAYNSHKIFAQLPNVSYEDGYCSFKGRFVQHKLLSLNSSEDVKRKVVDRMLRLYRP